MADDDRDERDERDETDTDDDAGDGDGDGDGNGSNRERELAAEAARYRRRLRESEQRIAELERQSQPEAERAIADAVAARESELRAEHARQLVDLRVQVVAAAKLRDPEDVPRRVIDELVDFADDPRELERRAASAIDELVERKPYLARDADNGDGDAGGRTRGVRDLTTAGSRDRDRDGSGRRDEGAEDAWLRRAARR